MTFISMKRQRRKLITVFKRLFGHLQVMSTKTNFALNNPNVCTQTIFTSTRESCVIFLPHTLAKYTGINPKWTRIATPLKVAAGRFITDNRASIAINLTKKP